MLNVCVTSFSAVGLLYIASGLLLHRCPEVQRGFDQPFALHVNAYRTRIR